MLFWDKFKIYTMNLKLTEYDIVVPKSVYFNEDGVQDKKIPKIVVKISSGTSENICDLIFSRRRMSFSEILGMLTKLYSDIPVNVISKDLKVYLEDLNKYGMIVYVYPENSSLIEKIKFYFWIFIRGYKNRQDIESSNLSLVLGNTLLFVLKTYLLLIVLFIFSTILLFLACFDSQYSICLLYYIIFVIGLFLSTAIHESIHLLTYRTVKRCKEGYLISKMFSIAFFREEISGKGRIIVRLLAPLITVMIGVVLFLSTDYVVMKILSSVFVFHVINLLPFFGDGYAIINDLLQGEEI